MRKKNKTLNVANVLLLIENICWDQLVANFRTTLDPTALQLNPGAVARKYFIMLYFTVLLSSVFRNIFDFHLSTLIDIWKWTQGPRTNSKLQTKKNKIWRKIEDRRIKTQEN